MKRGVSSIVWRDQLATIAISAVTALFGVGLIQGTMLLTDIVPADQSTAGAMIQAVAWVFIGLALYTAAVVTANTFTTIVAGRLRLIAQYRLLGATAARLRRQLAAEGLAAGVLGAVGGYLVATGLYWLIVRLNVDAGNLPPVEYTYVHVSSALPALVTVLTVYLAAYSGTRSIVRVSPVAALSASIEVPIDRQRPGAARLVVTWLLLAPGVLLLAGGAVLGAFSPVGVLVAFLGGVGSFTGIVVGASLIVPRLIAGLGASLRGVPGRLARDNALRSPRSATRLAIGMVIGVGLIVMFVVAGFILREVMRDYAAEGVASGELPPETATLVDEVVRIVMQIMIGLTAVSVVLAAIGMIANLALVVIQRRRELGLLRAVGASAGQVRTMIGYESLLSSAVAIGLGTVLGIGYGWVAAQSTIGFFAGGVVPLVVPWQLLVAVVVAVLALAVIAAAGPALRATRVTPIEALRVA